MPQQSVPIGMQVTMLAGIPYALPAVEVTIFTDVAATITQSNTAAFSASQSVTLTNGQARVAGGFIKAVADTLITLKRD